jgi:uncharacterized protein involved in type VI secretion and phage assembly
MSDVLARLMQFAEQWQRQAPMMGLAYAEVTGRTDEGFELRFLSGNFDATSAPARVASFMAGDRRGAWFMPEVGDEVVVGFELGDYNRPVILGALWSDVDQPPEPADTSSANNTRTIVSRAGHQITFDDGASGKIVIKTRGNTEITLEDGGNIWINTTGDIKTTKIVLDGVSWNHIHPSGSGPTEGPISMTPVPPRIS